MRWRILLNVLAGTGLLAGSLIAAAALTPARASVPAASSAVPLYAFNSGLVLPGDSGLVLTVGSQARPGAAVRIEADRGGSGQRWVFASHGTVRPASNSHLCLTVPSARYLPGTRLVVSACNSTAAERFARGSPSAHTPVFFVKPAARSGFCLSDLSASDIPQAGDGVGLEHCAALASQAWSTSNLDGVAAPLGDAWAMQARQPTVAGSAVTGAKIFGDKLDQIWTATVTGTPPQQQLVQLRPLDDTALCLTLPAAEAAGVRLVLAGCDGAANQDFMGIAFFFSASSPYFITTPDSHFCVQAASTGSADTRNIVIAGCTGNNRDVWDTTLGLVRYFASQYAEFYAGSGALDYSMTVSGHGVPGSGIVVERDAQLAAQVWTELAPGQVEPEGNADGSITLRPLSDESLCLTVPNAHYAAGVQLTVQTCDGAVSQEFLRSGTPIANSQELIAFGDGQFCVGEPSAVGAGSPVELKPCNQQANQAWKQYYGWADWGGLAHRIHFDSFSGPAVTLSSSTATGGQVSLGSLAPGDTGQFWTAAPGHDGFALRSVYNPGLCIDAPSATAGTQLVAAPCSGGSGQTFLFVLQAHPFNEYQLAGSGLCIAAPASTSGPLALATCAPGQQDELWVGPY